MPVVRRGSLEGLERLKADKGWLARKAGRGEGQQCRNAEPQKAAPGKNQPCGGKAHPYEDGDDQQVQKTKPIEQTAVVKSAPLSQMPPQSRERVIERRVCQIG